MKIYIFIKIHNGIKRILFRDVEFDQTLKNTILRFTIYSNKEEISLNIKCRRIHKHETFTGIKSSAAISLLSIGKKFPFPLEKKYPGKEIA